MTTSSAQQLLTQAVEAVAAKSQHPQLNGVELKPPTAAEWRAGISGYQILPSSGNVIRLKHIGIMELIEQGRIPQTLSAAAVQVAGTGLKTQTEKQLKEYIRIVNISVCACATEPRVVQRPVKRVEGGQEETDWDSPPPEDALYIDELPFVDREQIFKWACGLSSRLQPFRPKPD